MDEKFKDEILSKTISEIEQLISDYYQKEERVIGVELTIKYGHPGEGRGNTCIHITLPCKEQTLTGTVKGVLKDIEDIKKELQDIKGILEPKQEEPKTVTLKVDEKVLSRYVASKLREG